MVTIQMLQEKIARVQEELAEVRAALETLEGASTGDLPAAPPQGQLPLAGAEFADSEKTLAALDHAFAQMGIDVTAPGISPEEVQQLMLREGIRPEDRVLSRGIIEAREE
jgi:hypothetical protein